MASPNYTFMLVALAVSGGGNVGDCLVDNGSGKYLVSTTAARGTKRSSGLLLGVSPINSEKSCIMQSFNDCPTTVTGLDVGAGVGTAAPLIVSATGRLQRKSTPVSGDDVVGWVEDSGLAHLCFAALPYNFFNPGGGAFVPPTGTGFAHVTGGALDGASKKVDLADTADITNILGRANGGLGFNASNLTGQALKVIGVKSDETTFELQSVAAGASPGGTGTQIQYRSGPTTFGGLSGAEADTTNNRLRLINALAFKPGANEGLLQWTPTTSRTLTLPDATDTLVGKATTDTLTNKTMSGASNTFSNIPLTAVVAPTGTGLAKVSSGSWVGAAALLVDADVNAAAAIAGTKISPDFGSQQVATTGSIKLGSGTVHATAFIRWAYNGGAAAVYLGTRSATPADVPIIETAGGNDLKFGNTSMNSTINAVGLQLTATSSFALSVNSQGVMGSDGTELELALPVAGSSTFSLPFRWKVATISLTGQGTGPYTLTAAQYECPIQRITSGDNSVNCIVNAPNSAGAWMTVNDATGTTVVTYKVSGQTGVVVQTGKTAIIYCNGTDYIRVSPDA